MGIYEKRPLSSKVSVIGAGNVGSTFAFSLMLSGLAREIVIIDRNEQKANGECMDISHGMSLTHPVQIRSGDYESCAGSDIVVITAGANQKPGQSRIALVEANAAIFKEIIPNIVKYAKDAILVVVTNPVDILTYVTLKISGLPKSRVIGSGTVLDTSRFKYLISRHCNVDPRNVHAYIIGEHGDSELPVWSNANIGGISLDRYCIACKNFSNCGGKMEWENIFNEVKNAAYKIIEAKGASYYAVGLAIVRIVEAILRDENSILPVSSLISDYYGVDDICLSIPSIVNINGIEQLLRLDLSQEEQSGFQQSAASLRQVVNAIKF